MGESCPAKFALLYNMFFPGNEVKFLNKGISGDRTGGLLHRLDEDVLANRPDFIIILIGINDVWRAMDQNDPTSAEKFKENYELLLTKIKTALPEIKILIMEPFLLRSVVNQGAVTAYETWYEDLGPKIAAARIAAAKYADYFLALDGLLNEACADYESPGALAYDGVHPTNAGNSLIALEIMKFLKIV